MYLISRDAPSPEEKYKEVDNPLRNGVTDFSPMYGEKKFNNRDITYVFTAFFKNYAERKELERQVKALTVTQLTTDLYDTHNEGYHWLGKCTSATVEDDERFKTLTVTLVFSCYPYLYSNHLYYDDMAATRTIYDVLAWTKFEIDGRKEIRVYNAGERAVDVDILVDATPIVETDGVVTTEEVIVTTTPAVTHTVRQGEMLWSLAQKYGVTVYDIKKWNKLTQDWAHIGDVLIVQPAQTTTKTVSEVDETTTRTYYMKLTDLDDNVIYLNNNLNYSQDISLHTGWNTFKVEGNGTIAFHFRAEVMA